jgi:heme-degrading monooxygenase HmoA
MIAATYQTPYYAVIFTSIRTQVDNGYEEMAQQMMELAQQQDGFLGAESARNSLGITVSYWKDLESIKKWKRQSDHQLVQKKGRELWFSSFKTRIARVETDYEWILP